MQHALRALCVLVSTLAGLAAQTTPTGSCTGLMPAPVPTDVHVQGQQACRVGFSGALGDLGNNKLDDSHCPNLLVITPAHSDVVYRPGAPTDAKVNGQVATQLVVFRCVSHYFLFFWLHDTCEVSDIRTIGAVDNYITVPCTQSGPEAE